MKSKTKLGLDVLEAALLVGILGNALLRAMPWGVNVLLWVSALGIAVIALAARWRPSALKGEGRWLILPLIFFATGFAWRDSATLRALDLMCLLITMALIGWRARGGSIRLGAFFDYVMAALLAWFDAMFGFFVLVFGDISWKEIPRTGWSKYIFAITRGLLIALPLLLIFGGLFMAADAVFEGIVRNTLNLDFGIIFGHIFLTLFFGWTVAGFLRGALLGKAYSLSRQKQPAITSLGLTGEMNVPAKSVVNGEEQKQSPPPPQQSAPALAIKSPSLGIIEIGVVLGLLDALFLSFVIVQVRYFFGGAALVQATTSLTYAEYARRGFFELVTVAALVLPILLIAHWLLRKENASHVKIFRMLAGAQIALLFVIMTSAVARMRLYQSEYGLTELRLYTTAFMGWLALVFIWFVLTILWRGERERFACGALVAGFVLAGLLHLMNPDALIVRVNTAQAQQTGRTFDAAYAASLSADAVPALVSAAPALRESERCVASARLLERWSQPSKSDWRSWNWSRSRAQNAVAQNRYMLQGFSACTQPPPLVQPTEMIER